MKKEKTAVPALSDVVEHLSRGLHHSETLQRHTSDTLHCLIIIDQVIVKYTKVHVAYEQCKILRELKLP
jgi:hypothetical protein